MLSFWRIKIKSDIFQEVRAIEALAEKLHGSRALADAFTFRSIKEHADEIRDLLKKGDPHWKAEAVDLILHGHILLERYGVLPQEIGDLLNARTGRFKEKITAAMRAKRK
ncbi:MAG: hypothetical protein HQL21_07335 [Candidatus Omnitrophica bacterium]|nr:hypothetical protein [Candidatus Omnitrophota bacterium]